MGILLRAGARGALMRPGDGGIVRARPEGDQARRAGRRMAGGTVAGAGVTCGLLLRRYRQAARLTQEELAERSGYSANYLSKLERDQRRPPPVALDRLA